MIDRTLLRNILLLAACQGMLLCNGVTLDRRQWPGWTPAGTDPPPSPR